MNLFQEALDTFKTGGIVPKKQRAINIHPSQRELSCHFCGWPILKDQDVIRSLATGKDYCSGRCFTLKERKK